MIWIHLEQSAVIKMRNYRIKGSYYGASHLTRRSRSSERSMRKTRRHQKENWRRIVPIIARMQIQIDHIPNRTHPLWLRVHCYYTCKCLSFSVWVPPLSLIRNTFDLNSCKFIILHFNSYFTRHILFFTHFLFFSLSFLCICLLYVGEISEKWDK